MSAAACSAILSTPFGVRVRTTTPFGVRVRTTTPFGVVGAAAISTKTTTTIKG